MIAVDTNFLVYAHREDSTWQDAAYARIAEPGEGKAPWAIPWPCVHEFSPFEIRWSRRKRAAGSAQGLIPAISRIHPADVSPAHAAHDAPRR